MKALKDEDAQVRLQAIQRLEKFGPRAVKAIPALKEAAKDPDPFLRREADETLDAVMRYAH